MFLKTVLLTILIFNQNSWASYKDSLLSWDRLRYSKYFSFDIESKKSEEELEKHFNSYINKCKELGLDVDLAKYDFYYCKININKIKELKNIGVDLREISEKCISEEEFITPKDKFIFSQIVLRGKVTKIVQVPTDAKRRTFTPFGSYAIIKVDSVLKGKYYKNIGDFFKIYLKSGFEKKNGEMNYVCHYKERYLLNVGDDILLLHDKLFYESLDNGVQNLYPNDLRKVNVSSSDDSDFLKIINSRVLKNISKTNLAEYYKGPVDSIFFDENVKQLEDLIKKIDEINDTKNFYKRDYK